LDEQGKGEGVLAVALGIPELIAQADGVFPVGDVVRIEDGLVAEVDLGQERNHPTVFHILVQAVLVEPAGVDVAQGSGGHRHGFHSMSSLKLN